MTDWQGIAGQIAKATERPFEPKPPREIGGGCINRTVRLEDGDRRYFVKIHDAAQLPMFQAEAAGLAELEAAQAIRVPRSICHGTTGNHAYLVLEHLDLGGANGVGIAHAGRQLAVLHRVTNQRFGWIRDNTIGSTPQPNQQATDWVEFWRDRRLGFQLDLAARNGYGGRLQQRGERLLDAFPALFANYRPRPSLLHGDLWGGNLGFDEEGQPVIYDPAVYYGDREADLAMTELFGGFGSDFYAAYREAWPLDSAYPARRTLYNLYHILNHANMFGGGYAGQAGRMIDELLSQLG